MSSAATAPIETTPGAPSDEISEEALVRSSAAAKTGATTPLNAHALADARGLPLSAHCAPALHVHLGCALGRVRHIEYFHDHQRIERMLFDGATVPRDGVLAPDLGRPGLGLDLKRADAARFAA